jgi:hypothetical protein
MSLYEEDVLTQLRAENARLRTVLLIFAARYGEDGRIARAALSGVSTVEEENARIGLQRLLEGTLKRMAEKAKETKE